MALEIETYYGQGPQRDVTVMAFTGRIERFDKTADDFRDAVSYTVWKGGTKVLLDFEQVSHMDSHSLGLLMDVSQEAARLNREIQVCGVQGHVKELFDRTGFTVVLNPSETREQGYTAFKAVNAAPAPTAE